ncbi:MAG TPA: YdeI/OmpD-associated family protein [Planctomycetia bacterium]|nr:YdeI/OmpD-associated family protein [Planctomycetia bacterium]
MPKKDPRIDAYIEKAAPFAKKILVKFRALVHKGCPDIEETLKWRHPSFEYKGILCGMAAFKQHVDVGFWKGGLLTDSQGHLEGEERQSMRGLKITDVKELPPDAVIVDWVKQAVDLNERDVKPAKEKKAPKPALAMPPDFAAALKKNAAARKSYDAFPPSSQRDYLEWILDAKTDVTRAKRIATAVEWIAEGKRRHWKYER